MFNEDAVKHVNRDNAAAKAGVFTQRLDDLLLRSLTENADERTRRVFSMQKRFVQVSILRQAAQLRYCAPDTIAVRIKLLDRNASSGVFFVTTAMQRDQEGLFDVAFFENGVSSSHPRNYFVSVRDIFSEFVALDAVFFKDA